MNRLNVLDLCAGIGGFSLGLEATGHFRTVAFVEINPFRRQKLRAHWPDTAIYEDIYNVSASTFSEQRIDIITAGFPCQPFSTSGNRKGSDDARFIWPEIARLISEVRPRYVLLENVPGLLSIESGLVLGGILGFLAANGYDAEWDSLKASDFGASQQRERWFLVAYLEGTNKNCIFPVVAYAPKNRHQRNRGAVEQTAAKARGKNVRHVASRCHSIQPTTQTFSKRNHQSRMGGNVHGLPRRLDAHKFPAPQGARQYRWEPSRTALPQDDWKDRIESLGDSVIPQIIASIGRQIAAHSITESAS